MNEPERALADRLRRSIERIGMTLRDFSSKTGIPYRTLQNYLAGDRLPGADALEQMALFGLDVNWLLTGITREAPKFEHEQPGSVFINLSRLAGKSAGHGGVADAFLSSMEKTGLDLFLAKAAADRVDSLNDSYIKDSGKSYSFVELVNLYEFYAAELLSIFRKSASLIVDPPEAIGNLDRSTVLDMAERVIVDFLGEEARPATRNLLEVYASAVGPALGRQANEPPTDRSAASNEGPQ